MAAVLLRILEVIFGGLFLYAGVQKHLHIYEFAEAVLAYRLLPVGLAGVAAAVLPWVEIAGGLACWRAFYSSSSSPWPGD